MGLRESIGRGLNLAGDVIGAVGQAAGAVGQAGLGLAKAAVTVPEGDRGERSPLGKLATVVQGGAAGFAGRPDLAPQSNAEIQAQRTAQNQANLQQLNAGFQTLQNAVNTVRQLPEDRQEAAADSFRPQIAKAIPNGEVFFDEMLASPTVAEGMRKIAEEDPVFGQLIEIDPSTQLAQQFAASKEGLEYIAKVGSVSGQQQLAERIPDAIEFLRTNLPEDFARIEKDGITLTEFSSLNDALPEGLKLSPGAIASAEERPDILLQLGLTLPELDRAIAEAEGFDNPTIDKQGNLIQRNSKTNEVKILRAKTEGTLSSEARGTFRRDFRNASGEFVKIRNAWKTVLASSKGGPAGDISLIFAFMKMIDPASTVREGEFATVQNSGKISDRIRAIYNGFREGERFGSDEQRQNFVNQARDILIGRIGVQQELENTFIQYAKADGTDTKVGGAMIADFIGEERELVSAPDRLAAAQPGQRAAPTEDDVERIARQIGSRDPLAIRQAAEEEGFSF